MSLHVIAGAGGVGAATARLLADRGDQVKIVTRSGAAPEHPGVERIAADATDHNRLTAIAERAAALDNCANPRYDRWLTDWPPLASALLTAAERTGAVLTSAATLYGYGPVVGPMSETTPLAATHPKLRLAPRCGAMPSPLTKPGGSAPPKSGPVTSFRATEPSASWSPNRCSPANAPWWQSRLTSRTVSPRSMTRPPP